MVFITSKVFVENEIYKMKMRFKLDLYNKKR